MTDCDRRMSQRGTHVTLTAGGTPRVP
jgi:hypothetical protein